MAVKIVNPEPDVSVVKKIICRNCGVTLEYTPNDVRDYHGTDITGGPDGREWINCAKCGKEVTIRSW